MDTKIFIASAITIAASLINESAFASNQPRESVCLVIGKYAASAAEERERGTSEKELLSLLTPGKKGTPQGDLYVALQQVVAWIYTVQLSPTDTRKLVYAKCLDKEFFAYNPRLDG